MQRARVPAVDLGYVPAVVTRSRVREASLDLRALWMLPFIDGETALADVLERSGLPVEDARAAMRDLVASGLVALRLATTDVHDG